MTEEGNTPPQKQSEARPTKVSVEVQPDGGFKVELDGDLPPEVLLESAKALANVIKPFSAAGSVLAAYINLLHPENVSQVFLRAKQLLKAKGKKPTPVPPKMLIPLIDNVSREEADSDLLEMWASLLASAAEDYDAELMSFVQILGELSYREIMFLEETCFPNSEVPRMIQPDSEAWLFPANSSFELRHFPKGVLPERLPEKGKDPQEFIEHIVECEHFFGCRRVLQVKTLYPDDKGMTIPTQLLRDMGMSLHLLKRQGLVDVETATYWIDRQFKERVELMFAVLSPLAIRLVERCSGRKELENVQ